jgi:hypothetical protein
LDDVEPTLYSSKLLVELTLGESYNDSYAEKIDNVLSIEISHYKRSSCSGFVALKGIRDNQSMPVLNIKFSNPKTNHLNIAGWGSLLEHLIESTPVKWEDSINIRVFFTGSLDDEREYSCIQPFSDSSLIPLSCCLIVRSKITGLTMSEAVGYVPCNFISTRDGEWDLAIHVVT